jgi:nucleoside-diphosphate-sugar epimerase
MQGFEMLILGAGFTGSRVANRLKARGMNVTATSRATIDFALPETDEKLRRLATPGCRILHSIPPLDGARDRALLKALEGRAERVVYLSTAAVYGAAAFVDENTPVDSRDDRARGRLETENAVQTGPWSSLVLRPAAIYGPGRGAHVSLQAGRLRLRGDGSNIVSRIHVDDLAAIACAALLSDLTGTFPVADDGPCSSREIAEFCAQLLGLPMPPRAVPGEIPLHRQVSRRVNGSAIRRALGVELRYRSYREGIPASL